MKTIIRETNNFYIYICKVDEHLLEIEVNKDKDCNEVIKVWYSYDNNTRSVELYYNTIEDLLVSYVKITDRQYAMIKQKVRTIFKKHMKLERSK